MPDSFNLHHATCGRQIQPRGDLVFVVNNFGSDDLRVGGEAAARHLLGIAHQLVEMYSWRRYEGARTSAAFHHALALKASERMTGSHQAHSVDLGKLPLGIHCI